MKIKKLSLADKELTKEFFVNIFTKAPWYDDWSDKKQLDLYIIDLIGNVNPLTLPAYNFYKKNGYYEYPDTVAFSKGFGSKYE